MEGVTKRGAPRRPRSLRSAAQQVMALAEELIDISAPSLPACRRLCHHAIASRRGRADRERRDGRPHRDRMGQGRSRSDLDILKVDVLGLGMLSCLRRGLRSSAKIITARSRDLSSIPEDEDARLRHDSRADTIGVFQIESRAQMSMLPRLKPKEFYDLVIEVAIVRPGPIQGNMVHPYLRRREGIEPVEFLPRSEFGTRMNWKRFLSKTLACRCSRSRPCGSRSMAPGFSRGEAEQVAPRHGDVQARRGRSSISRRSFIEGMCERGYDRRNSRRIASSRSKASANTAFPKATPRALR